MPAPTCSPEPPLRVSEALSLIRERLTVIARTETVGLGQANGRVLAADVAAPIDLPPFDNAAVDGYALHSHDLVPDGPTTLPVTGRVPAGTAPVAVIPGSAQRIFTGAPIPPGADTVAMQEDARPGKGTVTLLPGLVPGANCRRAGEDVPRGGLALRAGHRLGPRDLALAAALGLTDLPVRARLRVGLFSTGDEVTRDGAGLAPAAIHDANRPMLAVLLSRIGALSSDLGIVRDEPRSLRERFAAAAADHDLIVTSGGVSAGEEDHVRPAIAAVGEIAFWKLAIKPGRPLAFGHVGRTPFLGLPGNPGAAYATGLAILVPLALHLSGAGAAPPLPLVRSGFALTKRAGRREYLKVCLRTADDGLTEALPAPGGALSGLSASDGLVELPEEATAIHPGDLLPYRPHDIP